MSRFFRLLIVPASETHMGVGLGLSVIMMALMLWAIMWQANIIAYQGGLIHWMLGNMKLGL